jgi:LmbE family N-acetylglucosaminyl deacetylase
VAYRDVNLPRFNRYPFGVRRSHSFDYLAMNIPALPSTLTTLGENFDAYVPQVRPHNRRREGKLFFLISKRPFLELSAQEAILYDRIDGRKTVAELAEAHPGSRDHLLGWHRAAVIELIPPVVSPARPHLVVIEPHMDDAALSTGGRLLHRRGRSRITIVSVVKWSNFTSYLKLGRDFTNVQEITELRQQESGLAARLLGAEHQCLDWTDAPLRFWPAERWSQSTVERFRLEPQIFTNRLPNPKDVSLLAEQLMKHLNNLAPDELWIPMGLGNHTDHRTTRSACLLMMAEARKHFSGISVSMYEDLPYAATPGHAAQVRTALAKSGTKLVRSTEDIGDVVEEKVRVVSVYASQFKASYIEPGIRGHAELEAGAPGKFAEAYHRVEGEVHLPPESDLSQEGAGLAALGTRMGALLTDRARRRRVTVMALPSGSLGKWKTDSESLAAAFPNADLRVNVPENMAWQAEEGGNDKLRLELVHGGWRGWFGVVVREFFHVRTPTIVLWRGAYGAAPMSKPKKLVNASIRALLPFRHLLFARTLWDVCCVLNEQLEGKRGRSETHGERSALSVASD